MLKEEEKAAVLSINEMSKDLEDSIVLLQNALFYNNTVFIDEVHDLSEKIMNDEARLTSEVVEKAKKMSELKPLVSVPGHLASICKLVDTIAYDISKKVREEILFSDKALSEITYLLLRTKEIMTTLSDFILAKNIFIANYIIESEKEIEQSATRYSTLHEDRLIEGICTTQASALYLHILDSIKSIVWHMKQIAEKLLAV